MSYLLFRPSSDVLEAAGFGLVAHVPVIFSAKWKYHRVANRYLRQRALGQTLPLDSGGGNVPTDQSLTTICRWLIDFLAWCDWAKTSWRNVEYTKDLLLRYQKSMQSGSWSASKEALAPSTINNRVSEAASFCAWAVRTGLRDKPFEIPYETTYRKSGGLSSHSHQMVPVKSRKGKVRPTPRDLSLPTARQVDTWLATVRARLGQTKALMCRCAAEVGLRRQEVVEWDLEYLGTNPERWKIKDGHVQLQIKFGAKGEKYSDNLPSSLNGKNPYERTVGPTRTVFVPFDLAMDILEYRNKVRPKLLAKYVNQGRNASERARRQSEVKTWCHRLFISEYDGRPILGPTLLKAFKFKPPYPEWHTHLGRHYFACRYLLRKLTLQWEASSRAANRPPPDWVLFQGQAALLMLKRQLGHLSEASTEMYLVWLFEAFGHSGEDYVAALESQPMTREISDE
jgi:hypothetical protein